MDIYGLDAPQPWDTERAFQKLQSLGLAQTKRTAERRLHAIGILPAELRPESLRDEFDRAPNQVLLDWALKKSRSQRRLVLFAQLHQLPSGQQCLHANDARGGRYWLPLGNISPQTIRTETLSHGTRRYLSFWYATAMPYHHRQGRNKGLFQVNG